jgi:hypothetical protein
MTEYKHMPIILAIGGLIINLGYVITRSRTLAEFIGFSIGYCGGVAAISYIIAKITARKNPVRFRLHFGWSFVIFSLLLIFGNIYSKL